MTTFVVPVSNLPQKFAISLAGKDYTMTCRWNDADEGGWVADFDDATSGDPIAANIPLITGADCLAGLEYLGFNGQLVVLTDGDQFAVPTLLNLGVESNLYFQTDVVDG
jgi:hypothetical protein